MSIHGIKLERLLKSITRLSPTHPCFGLKLDDEFEYYSCMSCHATMDFSYEGSEEIKHEKDCPLVEFQEACIACGYGEEK